MDISIIIVNYNVKDFLAQCLSSLRLAAVGLQTEIIVIDNHSTDGSKEYLPAKFPEVEFHWLDSNIGFGAANNIGINRAKGRYILLLNPDTILNEHTLPLMFAFMEKETATGIAGCRVLNADGSFQVACRRGFPTPWASFCKLFGLQSIFPHSPLFAQYNLTFKSEFETYDVDALIGAFMMCRKETLHQINGFDTDFFMYGEDLDLCFRAKQHGWNVRYYHEPTIIHFKGESTRRSTINEVKVFYDAMEIFAKKHYGTSRLFLMLLKLGIRLRSILAFLSKTAVNIGFITSDIAAVIASLLLATYVRFDNPFAFPEYAYPIVFIVMVLTTISGLLFSGAYFEHNGRIRPIFTGYFAAFFFLSSLTYFFKEYAFSRGVLLMSMGFSLIISICYRGLWHIYHAVKGRTSDRRVIIIGTNPHESEILSSLQSAEKRNALLIGRVKSYEREEYQENVPILGSMDSLQDIVTHHEIDEVLILDRSLDSSSIMKMSATFAPTNVRIHAVQEFDDVIVSRIADDISGISPAFPVINLQRLRYRVIKRVGDIALSLFFLTLGLPLVFLSFGNTMSMIKALLSIIRGSMSFVGIYGKVNSNLPFGKPGLTGLAHISLPSGLSDQAIRDLNEHYIRHYTPGLDLEILLKHLLRNGNSGFKLRP